MFFGRARIDRGESRSNRAVGRAPVCVAARDRRWCGYRRTDIGAAAIAAGLQSPRVGVVFHLRQCDKENQGWREGPPLTVACQSFDLPAGPSPSGIQIRTKEEYSFLWLAASPLLRTLAGLKRHLVDLARGGPEWVDALNRKLRPQGRNRAEG
jgi:hypothetical protein